MTVVLFYAMLIVGLGLVVSLYVALLAVPTVLIGTQYGRIPAATFAGAMLATMAILYEAPFGGVRFKDLPWALQPSFSLSGFIADPPVASLISGAVFGLAGFAFMFGAWLRRRHQK